jgi:hypothetical protein
MIQDHFLDLIDPALLKLGAVNEGGEEFLTPPLDVIRYYRRALRVSRVPFVGKALGVACVVRQPVDIEGARAGYERLSTRIAMAVNGRFPPSRAFVIGLTSVILTPEPIAPADDAMLRDVLSTRLRRMRVVPFGLIRVNVGQEAMALAMNSSPDQLFTEPITLADLLSEHFRRYVPLIDG